MATFKQMQNEGTIKRADSRRIGYDDIYIEPGFNAEGRHDPADPENISLLAYIKSGGYIPPLEVRPRDDGGVWIVEGHRRYVEMGNAMRDEHYAALLVDKDGVLRMDIVPFEGNDIDRHKRVVTSQSNMKLTPLQLGQRYKILRGFKLTPDEIAHEVHRTRQHVEQMLILADANHDVQEAVKDGDISATEAVKLQRLHGDNTAVVIAKAKDKAKSVGKAKVTAGTIKPWSPPAKVVTPLVARLDALVVGIPDETRNIMAGIEGGKPWHDETVMINAGELFALIDDYRQLTEARSRYVERQSEKQAKMAQKTLELAGEEKAA